jgi:hypothetical protein
LFIRDEKESKSISMQRKRKIAVKKKTDIAHKEQSGKKHPPSPPQ